MGRRAYASRWLALSALVLLLALPAAETVPYDSAKTEHFFPLIVNGDGFQSHLFVTNVSGAANQCSLSLRGPGLDSGIFRANDAVSFIGRYAAIDLNEAGESLTLTSIGEQALTFGYAKLDCPEPAAARMLLSLKNSGTPLSLATLESASPGKLFQFPVLPRLGRLAMVFSSEADLDAACAVEFEDGTGASLSGGNVTVPAESTTLRFLDELIQIPDDFDAGKARVSCNRDVAALGLPLSSPVFTVLPAITLEDDAAQSSHLLPLIQDGGGFRSQLLLTNLAESGNRCSIDLRGGALDTGRFEIPAGATATGSSVTLEFAARGDQASLPSTGELALVYGYAAIECDGPVDAQNLMTTDAGDNLTGMAPVLSARSTDGMEFPVVPGLERLALAMSNDAESDATCAVELLLDGKTISDTGLFQVASRSTSVRFLGDLFAIPDDFPGGMARLSCYSEVTATSLLIGDAIFAAMPPAVLPVRTNPESERTIPDGNLRVLISRQLDKPPGAAIHSGDLADLRRLVARNAGIENLEGLQHATELTWLDLGPAPWNPEHGSVNSNRVTDLSPIFGLSNLEVLNLSGTQLSGPIPSEFGLLANLRYLNLWRNQLTGDIPAELGQLSNLETLDLWGNELSGPIPAVFGQLGNLRFLRLGGNQHTGGIPGELGQLSDLETLDLWGNELSGPIPPELGQLGNLRYLRLGGNQHTGDIPGELGQLSSLETLDFLGNELSGAIPSELGQLGNLRYLRLGGNQLAGDIPEELGQLSNLEILGVCRF